MKSPFGHIRRIAIILFVFLRLSNAFLKIPFFDYLSAVVLLFVILQNVPTLDKVTRNVVMILFLGGILALFIADVSFAVWLNAWLKNANIVTMLICMPMMSMPFFYEDYQSELKVVAQEKMQTILGFCLLTSICTHLLGVMITVGTIAIIYDLLSPHAKLYNAEDTFLSTLLRSYSTSGFWSPAWTSMVLVNTYLEVSWLSLIPIGVLFSALFIAMDLGTVAWKMHRQPQRFPRLHKEEGEEIRWRKINTMLLLAAALIGLIVLGNLFTSWSPMTIIPLVSIIFPFLAALVQGHLPAYQAEMNKFYQKSLLKVQTQCALYTAAGFLGVALEAAGVGALIPRLIPHWFMSYPALMIGTLLILLILPALGGIHPAVTITVLLSTVTPQVLGLDNMSMALTMLTGCLMGTCYSPLTSSSLILSSLCGRPSWELGPGLNKTFGPASILAFSVLIAFFGPLLA